MSLSRLALRLAAYEALNPYASISSGPWPTCAGANIYDSRLDPIEAPDEIQALLAEIEGKPIVTLYTEEDEGEPYPGAEYPIEVELVTLVAELMIAARGEIEVEQANGSVASFGAVTAPITDRQHEMLLDVLEAQIRRIFDPGIPWPTSALLQGVIMEVRHIHSVPQRGVDRVIRVAARTLKFHLRVITTRWPLLAASPPPTGLALLPEPLLTVAQALDPQSSGGQACAAAALLLQQPAALVPLQGIAVFGGLDRAAAPSLSNGANSDMRGYVDANPNTNAPAGP